MHENHRERMRKRYLQCGNFDGFSTHELLEMALYYTVPRSDTNETAHLLLDRFKNLRGVCSAKPDELKSVPGVGDQSAVFLKLVAEMVRRCAVEREENVICFPTVSSIAQYFCNRYYCVGHEQVYAMFLNNRMNMVDCILLSEGTVNASEANTRMILEAALWRHVGIVVLAHNHPGGLAVPSGSDIDLTVTLQNALGMFDITLLEHLVIAEDRFCPIQQLYCKTFRSSPIAGRLDSAFYEDFYDVDHLAWKAAPVFPESEQ